ncbi:hypothetical protein TWF718_005321 [Orbilia javanica]|uniref:Uncharacterized protein n=1 Tax=Orbilia javanica TaxID=47235 RepID=A0AAN8N046_9PEZI
MPSLFSSLTNVSILGLWLGSLVPASLALADATVKHERPVIRDRISSYNVSFSTEEFDTLGDLDWRPLDSPYEGLLWNNFRVGANKHFVQYSGGKDAFAQIPLDRGNRVTHDNDPSITCVYNGSDIASFSVDSLLFGCALRSGIPVECNVDFEGIDDSGRQVGSQSGAFLPPYARMNSLGRLEAGKAYLQPIKFKPGFRNLRDLRFRVANYSVLFAAEYTTQTQVPLDVSYSGALLLIINGVTYTTSSTAATEGAPLISTDAPVLKKGFEHVTDCFDLAGMVNYNTLPFPWKDLQYDGFYIVKHGGEPDGKCSQMAVNITSGHLYAPGLTLYNSGPRPFFPSIGIDYMNSKRKDMSIKSFFIGCEQFIDETGVLDTQTPCVIGMIGLVSQKRGNKPQGVIYQTIGIGKSSKDAAPEDDSLSFVELADGDHLTRLYFVLISADPQATSVAITLDNFTYYTRGGKWPQTGNKAVAATSDPMANDILQAISKSYNLTISGLPAALQLRQDIFASMLPPPWAEPSPPPRLADPGYLSYAKTRSMTETLSTSAPEPPRRSQSGRVWPRGNSTFTFEDAFDVDPKTGFFKITEESTAPFQFGPEWKGRHQDAQGNPKEDVLFNNATWPFGPVNATRQNFAFVKLAWANRGSPEWNNSAARIRIPSGPGHPVYQIRELVTSCYPDISTDEDKARLNMLGGAFECHFTVFGFKDNDKGDPAEHAIDFSSGSWQNWRWDTFPRNFKGVNTLEFHATYASTRNLRIFIDDIKFESF